jgi:hypothetical protein
MSALPCKPLLVLVALLLLPVLPKEKSGDDFKVLGQLGKIQNQYEIFDLGLGSLVPAGKDYQDFAALANGDLRGSAYADLATRVEFAAIDYSKTKALLIGKGLSENASSCLASLLLKTQIYAGYMYLDREIDALPPSQVPLVWLYRWLVVSQFRNGLGQQDISPANLRLGDQSAVSACEALRVLKQ